MRGRLAEDILALLVAVVVCQLAGAVGALFTAPAIPGWYSQLAKPPFNPPSWVFAPVWMLLYLLMGVSAFLVWRKVRAVPGAKLALAVFSVQLLLNAAWSPVFFGLQSLLGGLCVIIPLWIAIVATIALFWRISAAAGALLVPYLLWVSFAAVLNYSIYTLN